MIVQTHLNGYVCTCCCRYGAKLVQPTGYVITQQLIQLVKNSEPTAAGIWTGVYAFFFFALVLDVHV